MGEHNLEGVRFFAPKEEEHVPAPAPEAAARTKRPAPDQAAGSKARKKEIARDGTKKPSRLGRLFCWLS